MIRRAGIWDIPDIVSMGHKFHALTAYAHIAPIDAAALRERLLAMIHSRNGDVVFIAERDGMAIGMLGAIITGPWFNPHYRVTQEIFWWVEESARNTGAGSRLLEALEEWWPNHSQGLLMLRTPNIEVEKMDALYRAKGFIPWDGYYMKTR